MRDWLLAKSLKPGDDPAHPPTATTYTGHTVAVVTAALVLLTHRGAAALKAAGLPPDLLDRLRRIVLLAALIHDLGKASSHFQALVRKQGKGQLIRHEAVSAWLAWREPLRSWLASGLLDSDDLPIAIAAAAGHHRKFAANAVDTSHGLGESMLVHAGHQDVAGLLRYAVNILKIEPAPTLQDCDIIVPLGGYRVIFAELEHATRQRLRSDPYSKPLLALAKAFVLDADVAGSALPRIDEDSDWIVRQLTERAKATAVESLIAKRLNGHNPRPFQQDVAACTNPVVLIEAGCGSGKTLAAYLWFAQQHLGRQLWITYPTTGTALEGFRDYLHGIDDLVTDLESGRRDLDLELCGISERQDADDAQRDADRIASLRGWGKHAIACTVDTVLGLVQNQRKGLYAWAGLADSAVVFDEIHAYDDRLFGCLLRFLRDLPGIPALLMTASLPTARRDALDHLCRERHGQALTVIPGPKDLEDLPRYQFVNADPWSLVNETLAAGGKVLWVSNTVDRCLDTADRAIAAGHEPLIYHSRFRYLDRVQRHRAVIDAFDPKKCPGSCLAVTTQVAEMSLDLSADLLVTDVAPVSALIQRLGRLNRRSTPDNPQSVKPALVVKVEQELPYDKESLSEAREWIARLADRDCSQRDLITAWKPPSQTITEVPSAWFDGGFDTEPKPVRKESHGITVVRAEDVAAIRADPRQAKAMALPMPTPKDRSAWLTWKRIEHLPIAPANSIDYHDLRGARWAK